MKFSGKVVLVTGASSRTGAAISKKFAKSGATLALTAKGKPKLDKVAAQCNNSLAIPADLTKQPQAKSLVDQVIKKFGKIDVLVNNAEVFEMGSIETSGLDQYERVIGVNVRAVYYLGMLTVKHLIKSKGNMVNVSSLNGLRVFPGMVAYNISKNAIDHFTRAVALELGPLKVRANAVNPGLIEGVHKEFIKWNSATPMERLGKPSDVANAVAFLASDEDAGYITGINLPVDGGRYVWCPR